MPSPTTDPIGDVVEHLSRHDRLKAIAACDAIELGFIRLEVLVGEAKRELAEFQRELDAWREKAERTYSPAES